MKILCALLYILVNPYTLSHFLASKVDSNQTDIRFVSQDQKMSDVISQNFAVGLHIFTNETVF